MQMSHQHVPVFRLWLISSACRGCECVLARDRGEGQLAIPVEQLTSAPQKIRLSVSSTSLLCTFIQRACEAEERKRNTTADTLLEYSFKNTVWGGRRENLFRCSVVTVSRRKKILNK